MARAREEIGSVGDRELLLCGVVLYWAEGSKSKPWSRGHRVTFMDSDPGLIRLFIRWVGLLGIERDRLILRVQIHESADVERAQREWSRITGIPVESFRRPTLKRHNPRTRREERGGGLHRMS